LVLLLDAFFFWFSWDAPVVKEEDKKTQNKSEWGVIMEKKKEIEKDISFLVEFLRISTITTHNTITPHLSLFVFQTL
jgi:hypothetical protein